MPPINWTSKCRIPSTRLEASLTTANASGSTWSSSSPWDKRVLNSAVFARNASSESAATPGSSALMRSTCQCIAFSRRELRLPNIFVSALVIIGNYATCTERIERGLWRKRKGT
jgi:hypothetical protein